MLYIVIYIVEIAKALGIKISDFFNGNGNDNFLDVNSYDGSLMEKIKVIDTLSDEEKKIIFIIVDAFVGKKKLKDTLSNVLAEAN